MAEICPFNITPLAMPRFVNNLPVYNLNYTNQDYRSLKARAIELIRTNFGDEFNDVTESSLGMMLIECWASMADMLSFKIDQVANELYMDTVTEIENAFRISKLVGFKPMPPLPAKAMFMAKLNNLYSVDVELKTPVVVSLENYDINYELYAADSDNNPILDSNIIIPASSLFTESIVGIEGQTRVTTFESSGKANQIFVLPYENVFLGSIKVSIRDILWKQVEYFTESKPKEEYIVEYGAYYKPTLIFGNNKAGCIPPKGTKIVVKCRIANKNRNQVISGAFETTISANVPGVTTQSIVHVKNYTKSDFGYNGDGIRDIRKKLPEYVRTQDRAVTGADYKYLTDSFATPYDGSIGKSTVILRNHGCAGNIIDIIVLSKTGDYRLIKANDNLKKMLLETLNKKKMLTDNLCIKDGEVNYVDINIDAYLNTSYKKFEKEIKEKIAERLEDYFNLNNWEFGKSLKEKDIIKSLSIVKEVKQFDIGFTTNKSIESNKGLDDSVVANYNEVLRPDSIHINFIFEAGE